MFQRILLAWPAGAQPSRSLDLARTLADTYEAELVVCCLGDDAIEAQAAGVDRVELLSEKHAERALLQYAHAHGFDLLVVGRNGNETLVRQLLERASLPLLVVSEARPS